MLLALTSRSIPLCDSKVIGARTFVDGLYDAKPDSTG